jgi:phenylpropionate dioxygenase-like ring-hydroxylating dioxygenase large terminal subunit
MMFIRNAWYIAAWAHEVGDKPLGRRICNEPVVLFRDRAGKLGALVDKCCHRGTPLKLGHVVDGGLECTYHGMVFDTAGACVHIPGQDRIPEKARVRSYPIVEKDEFAWIWMGDAAAADPSLIIDYPFHNDYAKWPHKHALYHIAGNHMLMVDNLMDLTHLGYVHRSTIGGNPSAHVEAKMETTRTEKGLRYVRWLLNSVPPPTYVKAAGFKGRVDRWQEFEFIAPASVIQWTGALDVGKGAYEEGNREGGFSLRLFHGLTPETETSCHYFWSTANGYRQDEPAATEQLYDEIAAAFLEDKAVVEEQQARLTELGEGDIVDIVSDVARIHMRRVVDRMLAAEQTRQTVAAE